MRINKVIINTLNKKAKNEAKNTLLSGKLLKYFVLTISQCKASNLLKTNECYNVHGNVHGT